MAKLKSRISWREKLENPPKDLPKVVDIPPKTQKRFGTGKMLIQTPLLIDSLIRKVPKGKIVTVSQIRERLAKDFRADTTCPLTTGIFLRIAAEVAEEDFRMGKKQVTPYWRVIRDDGSLNEKFPGGVKAQAELLKGEGQITDAGKGKKSPRVKDFEQHLVRF